MVKILLKITFRFPTELLLRKCKTENPNYLFVTIETKNVPAQDIIFTFKNNDKSFTQKYSLKSRRENSRLRKSYDSSDMIYLIMSDRFSNGNPTTTVLKIPMKKQIEPTKMDDTAAIFKELSIIWII
jgi:catabolite regulation protein CreA